MTKTHGDKIDVAADIGYDKPRTIISMMCGKEIISMICKQLVNHQGKTATEKLIKVYNVGFF